MEGKAAGTTGVLAKNYDKNRFPSAGIEAALLVKMVFVFQPRILFFMRIAQLALGPFPVTYLRFRWSLWITIQLLVPHAGCSLMCRKRTSLQKFTAQVAALGCG